jgi:hypothetical protein
LNSPRIGEDSERRFRQPKAGRIGGDDQVACQDQLDAAADRDAVDRGDDRLRERKHLREPRESPGAVIRSLALAGGDGRLHVPARAEDRPGAAAQDRDVILIVGHEIQECLSELATERHANRVHLGISQRYFQDALVSCNVDLHHVCLAKCRPCGRRIVGPLVISCDIK